ncbi:MAG: GNAT family N-acetyltransferase [bacterium]|nr:GNAT family N-acetyltransferase [bacterium]
MELRPLHDRDIPVIFELVSDDSARSFWPLLGRTWSLGEFRAYLWHATFAPMSIVSLEASEIVGHVQTFDVDPRSKTASVGFFIDSLLWNAGWPIEGLVLYLNYVLDAFGYRKLYFHVPEYHIHLFDGAVGRWLVEEGRMRSHLFADGGYHDQIVLALTADRWETDLVLRATANPVSGPTDPIPA